MFSRSTLNVLFWSVGLAFQCALGFVVIRRKIVRRFPAFTVLILFYPLRSALLFALGSHLPPAAYSTTYNALGLLAFPLQAAVAIEIVVRLMSELGGWSLRRTLLLLGLLAAAGCLTLLMARILPSQTTLPVDRLQILASFVMLLLFAWVAAAATSKLLQKILLGFALFAAIQLLVLIARAHAAFKHNPAAYGEWAYALATGYLVVVIFWTVSLRAEPGTRSEKGNRIRAE